MLPINKTIADVIIPLAPLCYQMLPSTSLRGEFRVAFAPRRRRKMFQIAKVQLIINVQLHSPFHSAALFEQCRTSKSQILPKCCFELAQLSLSCLAFMCLPEFHPF